MTADDSTTPGPPAGPAAAPRPRWLRRVLLGLGVLVLLAGILLALLPSILSSGRGRSVLEREATAALGMRVAVGSLDLEWSKARVGDLSIAYGPAPADPVLLRASAVSVPVGIGAALGSRYDLGTVEILRPEVRLDLKALTAPAPPPTPAAAAPGAPPGGAGEAGAEEETVPPFSVRVVLREGSLVVVDLSGKEARLGSFSGELTASRDAPSVLDLRVDAGPRGKVRIRAKGEPFAGGKARDTSEVPVDLEAAFEAFDLAPWREAACALGEVAFDRAEGVVTGSASGRVVGGGVEDGKATLDLRGVVLEGPELGEGMRIAEREARVEGTFRVAPDGTVEIRECVATAPGLAARGGVVIPPGTPSPGAPASLTWGPAMGSVSARGDAHELLPRLKALGVVPPQVDRTNGRDAVGDFVLDLSAASDASAQRWTGSLRMSDVQVAPGRGRAPLEEPEVRLGFDVVDTGKALRFDGASLRSGTAVLDLSGSWSATGPCDLRVKGQVQVARAAQMAALLDAEPPGTLSGTAEVAFRFAREAAGGDGSADEASGTIAVRDFLAVPPGAGAKSVKADLLEIAFRGIPGKDGVDLRELSVRGGGADLRASGRVAPDLSRGSLASLEADVDLARLAAVADAVGAALGFGVSGSASWKGPLSWTGGFDGIAAGPGTLVARDLVATIPGEAGAAPTVLREDEVRAALEASVVTTAAGTAFDLRNVGIATRGVEAAVSGTIAADGRLDLLCTGTLALADLGRRAAEQGILARDPAPRGSLALVVAVRGDPADPEIGLHRFETEGAEVSLSASGTFSAGGAADVEVRAGGGVGPILGLLARAGIGPEPRDEGGTADLRLRASAPDGKAPLRVSSELRLRDLSLPGPPGGAPWTRKEVVVAADGSFDRRESMAEGTVEVRTEDGTATVRGKAALASGKRSVDASADLDLDLAGLCRARPDLLPLPDMVVGRVKGTAKVAGPVPEPFDAAGLAGTASLAVDSVRTEPFEARDAAVDAELKGGVLHAKSVAAVVNEGKVAGSAALGLAGASPKHTVALRADGVRLDRALGHYLRRVVPLFAVGESGTVAGRLTMDLRLEGEGADWKAVRPNLHGQGSLEVADATVTGSGVLGGVLRVLDALDLGGGGEGLGLGTVGTAFAVHDERVWNERLTVNGTDRSMVLKGSTSFDGDLDYTVGVRVPKGLAKRAGPLLDADGNLPLALRGKLSKPRVKAPDLKKALGGAASDLLKKKLKGLLGGDDDEK